jgi:hypothetical protein
MERTKVDKSAAVVENIHIIFIYMFKYSAGIRGFGSSFLPFINIFSTST